MNTEPVAPPVAGLQIASFELDFLEVHQGRYWYLPKIVLTETSGLSAATLKEFEFQLPNGDRYLFDDSAPIGTGCLLTHESRTVPAGGRWDSGAVYYYCLPIDASAISGQRVSLTITFADEKSVPGKVSGSAIAP